MQLVWSLLGLVLIAYIWVRIFSTYFSSKVEKNTLIKTIVFAGLVVILLFVYQWVPEFFGQKISSKFFSFLAFILFAGYCLIFILFLTIQLKTLKIKSMLKLVFIGVSFFILIGVGGIVFGVSSLLLYYITSAYAEELLKFSVGENLTLEEKQGQQNIVVSWQQSRLIFISVLVGFGFSLIETMLYLVNSYILAHGNIISLGISRGIFAGLLHVCATGLIAYFVSKNRGNLFSGFIVGILFGVVLHFGYNLSLYYHITLLTILILISCYFILSYLLFNSDTVYEK